MVWLRWPLLRPYALPTFLPLCFCFLRCLAPLLDGDCFQQKKKHRQNLFLVRVLGKASMTWQTQPEVAWMMLQGTNYPPDLAPCHHGGVGVGAQVLVDFYADLWYSVLSSLMTRTSVLLQLLLLRQIEMMK